MTQKNKAGKREKYPDWQFDLKDCKVQFNVIPFGKEDPGFATVFMNVTFPDGRWAPFRMVSDARVPVYRDKKEEKVEAV